MLICVSVARAEDLAPELAVFAQARENEITALDAQKKAAEVAAQVPYLAALDTADQTAMSGGKVLEVAGIARKRERLQKGGMSASFPTDLPKGLDPARRNYFRSVDKVDADLDKQQLAVDAAYLQNLASLQFKLQFKSDPTLAAQIMAEKQKVAAGVHGPITDTSVGLVNTRWRSVNGKEVWEFKDGKLNNTWRYETPERDKVRVVWNPNSSLTLKLGRDGKTLLGGSNKPDWELMTPERH